MSELNVAVNLKANDDGLKGELASLEQKVAKVDKALDGVEAASTSANQALKTNKQRFADAGNAAKAANDEVFEAERAYKNLSDELQKQITLLGKTELEQAQLRAEWRLGANATDQQRIAISSLVAEHHRLRTASIASSGKTSKAGNIASQVGYQFSDLTLQIQGGQNAFLAIGQQGGQLVQAFSPIAGLIFTLAAAAAGSLAPAFFKSADATEKLTDALEVVDRVTSEAADGTRVLSDELGRLAQKSKQAAQVEVALGMVKAKEAIKAAGDQAKESAIAFSGWFADTDMKRAVHGLGLVQAQVARTGKSLDEVLNQGATNSGIITLRDLRGAIKELGDEYGLTRDQAIGYISAVGALQKDQSPETIKALASYVSELALNTTDARPKLVELASALQTASLDAGDAAKTQELLALALKDVDTVLASTSGSLENYNGKLKEISSYGGYQTMRDSFVAQSAAVGEMLEQERASRQESLAGWDQYYAMRTQIQQHHAQQSIEIEKANVNASARVNQQLITSTAQLTGQLASMAEEGSAAQKAAFIVQQGLALAQNWVMTALAATSALAPPPIGFGPVAGVPYAQVITGIGAANAALITAQSVAGMAHDGIDKIPNEGTWLLDKGERVIAAPQAQKLDQFLGRQAANDAVAQTVPASNINIYANDAQSFEDMFRRNSSGALRILRRQLRTEGSLALG